MRMLGSFKTGGHQRRCAGCTPASVSRSRRARPPGFSGAAAGLRLPRSLRWAGAARPPEGHGGPSADSARRPPAHPAPAAARSRPRPRTWPTRRPLPKHRGQRRQPRRSLAWRDQHRGRPGHLGQRRDVHSPPPAPRTHGLAHREPEPHQPARETRTPTTRGTPRASDSSATPGMSRHPGFQPQLGDQARQRVRELGSK